MSQETVYVLHKNGAPNHYEALDYYLKKRGNKSKYREFSIIGSLYKSIVKLDFKLFTKQIINLSFLVNLIFTKNKRVIFGIPPFDKKLIRLMPLLRNHIVFYHSSWTCWDGTFQPKQHKNSQKLLNTWRVFLEKKVKHIFAVSSITKSELLHNYDIAPENISTVYHTLRDDFLTYNLQERTKDCIYIGRLVPQKGINELVEFFSERPDKTLTIIGNGKLEGLVQTFANKYPNIYFRGKIIDAAILKDLLQKHRYLVLNSIKKIKWEELFGIVIIECMSQGVIPISTNHSGPKSIITKDLGYLYEEGRLKEQLDSIFQRPYNDEQSKAVLKASKFYSIKNISEFWAAIEN